MNVTVTHVITLSPELIKILTSAVTSFAGEVKPQPRNTSSASTTDAKLIKTPSTTKPDASVESKQELESEPATVSETDQDQEPETEPENDEVPDSDTSFTLSDVRALVAKKTSEGKRVAMKELLNKYEVPNVAALPPDRFAEFMSEAGAA